MTGSIDVTPKTTEHNLIVRIKSKPEVTNNKRLRSRYCTVEAYTDIHEASRGLSVPCLSGGNKCYLIEVGRYIENIVDIDIVSALQISVSSI